MEGESFLEVSFSGNEAPYSAYGRYYQRFADEDRAISDIQLDQLFKLLADREEYYGSEGEAGPYIYLNGDYQGELRIWE